MPWISRFSRRYFKSYSRITGTQGEAAVAAWYPAAGGCWSNVAAISPVVLFIAIELLFAADIPFLEVYAPAPNGTVWHRHAAGCGLLIFQFLHGFIAGQFSLKYRLRFAVSKYRQRKMLPGRNKTHHQYNTKNNPRWRIHNGLDIHEAGLRCRQHNHFYKGIITAFNCRYHAAQRFKPPAGPGVPPARIKAGEGKWVWSNLVWPVFGRNIFDWSTSSKCGIESGILSHAPGRILAGKLASTLQFGQLSPINYMSRFCRHGVLPVCATGNK